MQYQALTENIQGHYKNNSTGHDWFHILRVRNMAVGIAEKENGNKAEVELLALLHEFTDNKLVKEKKV